MSNTIHKTKVVKIGAHAAEFLEENMLIFFHEDVPPYLADFCYLIEPGAGGDRIQVGDLLFIGDTSYPITAIGDVALTNFHQLGHLTVRFDGASTAAQPGSLHVQQSAVAPISVGTEIRFERNG